MRETLKLVLTLGLVTMISGAVLGLFYEYTMPIVEARQMEEMMEKGFKNVLPEAITFQEVETGVGEKPEGIEQVYQGFDQDGNAIGVAFETVGQGFGGPIKMIIGLNPKDQQLLGVKVMNHAETPGLGAKVEEASFLDQFQGKSILDSFVVKQDVDGVTGATVSSMAVSAAVGSQSRNMLQYLGQEVAALPEQPQPVETASQEQEPPPVIDLAEVEQAWYPESIGRSLLEDDHDRPPGFSGEDEIYLIQGENDRCLGLVLVVNGEGFGGKIKIAAGLTADLTQIVGLEILEQQETPGLGAKIAEEEFRQQFTGKSLTAPLALGQDLNGITGATISSTAVADLVREKSREAAEFYQGRLNAD